MTTHSPRTATEPCIAMLVDGVGGGCRVGCGVMCGGGDGVV